MSRLEEVKEYNRKTTELMADLANKGCDYQMTLEAGKINILADISETLAKIYDLFEEDLKG